MGDCLAELGGDGLDVDPAERSILERTLDRGVGCSVALRKVDPVVESEPSPHFGESGIVGANGADHRPQEQSVEMQLELLPPAGQCSAREPERLAAVDEGDRC